MNETVVDVVHRHDRCCGFRRLDRRWRHHHACGGFHCGRHNRISGRDRARQQQPVFALWSLCFVGHHLRQVEPDVLSEIRNLIFQLIDRHIPSSDFQCLPADLAVAGAELVSLQGVQDA